MKAAVDAMSPEAKAEYRTQCQRYKELGRNLQPDDVTGSFKTHVDTLDPYGLLPEECRYGCIASDTFITHENGPPV
jgi:hypothetical protein